MKKNDLCILLIFIIYKPFYFEYFKYLIFIWMFEEFERNN